MGRAGVMVAVVALAAAGQAHVSTRGRSHTVARGDTLSGLGARYGVGTAALARANDLADPDRIRVGQVLVVPGPAADAPPTALASTVVVAGEAASPVHRVAPGETLGAIARRYDTTVGELARANDLADPDRVRAGAELDVPGPAWVCPVAGARFRDDWGAARSGGRRHLGNDVFAERGTPVRAPVAGAVTHAPGPSAGLAFYLRGDDGMTYYGAHLDELGPTGPVGRGTVLGTVGSTGNASATAPHLHFEIKPGGGDPVNPFFTLTRWCR